MLTNIFFCIEFLNGKKPFFRCARPLYGNVKSMEHFAVTLIHVKISVIIINRNSVLHKFDDHYYLLLGEQCLHSSFFSLHISFVASQSDVHHKALVE